VGGAAIFVRLGGCNLKCELLRRAGHDPYSFGNVWSADRVKAGIVRLNTQRPHRAVSWTGGETPASFRRPRSADALGARGSGSRNYLETNGTLPAAMRALAPLCDAVSMDVKLTFFRRGATSWARHRAFLMKRRAEPS